MEYWEIQGAIDSLARRRGQYPPEAYLFTIDALNRAADDLPVRRHLSGHELLKGIVCLAHQEFGRMAVNVFNQWGISRTGDFGVIVHDLIDEGILSKTEDDRLEDFEDVFDLVEELEEEAWRQRWRVGDFGEQDKFQKGRLD